MNQQTEQIDVFKDPCGFYARLGVTPTSTHSQISQEYHYLALLHHPDALSAHTLSSGGMMQLINEAYAVLGDPVLRARYDRYRCLGVDIPWDEYVRQWSTHATHWYDPDPQPSLPPP